MQEQTGLKTVLNSSMVIGGILYVPDGEGGMVEVGPDPCTEQTRINLEHAALLVSGLAFSQAEVDCEDCERRGPWDSQESPCNTR